MTELAAADGIAELLSSELAIELISALPLYRRAFQMASSTRQSAIYDSLYLALAEALGGELWTADVRFYRVASAEFSNVRWLREADVLN